MDSDYKAKEYFSYYHKGLNRRGDDPINSRLNYGYAVVKSSIARSLVASGFHPTFGIHHDSQLNAFNLADDLIEPYRAIVDVAAHENIGSNVQLSKSERKSISHVLHNACIIIRGTASVTVNSSNRKYGGDNRMRLLVILSPTDKWGTKTEYTKLRKFLQMDGYIRITYI